MTLVWPEGVAPMSTPRPVTPGNSAPRMITVLLPGVVTRHLWEEPLPNQLGLAIELALWGTPDVVVSTVRVQLHT